jgi:hypothetical protein
MVDMSALKSDHPLLARIQKALLDQLTRNKEKAKLRVAEVQEELKKLVAHRENIGEEKIGDKVGYWRDNIGDDCTYCINRQRMCINMQRMMSIRIMDDVSIDLVLKILSLPPPGVTLYHSQQQLAKLQLSQEQIHDQFATIQQEKDDEKVRLERVQGS